MPKAKKARKQQDKKLAPEKTGKKSNQFMKAFDHSKVINNFGTNFQFTRDIGIELLKGTATPEQILVLRESIKGIKEFIDILGDKLVEIKNK